MNKTVLLGTLTALLGWATSSAAGNADTTHHVSQPVYAIEFQMAQDFLGKTGALEQAFKAFCEENSEGNQTLKQAWHMTMLSWMTLQGQERGPAAALEQSWNVQFWPDKKNTTGRKMHALIASEKAWNADEISAQSVTVQGLGAVEWLLYDKASTLQNNAGACATGIAIAENLHNTAQKISDAWKLNPWTSLSQDAWESEYISLLSNQLDYSLKKLKRPLADIGKPKPYFAESWRSETSLSNLKANLQGMQTLYLANGEGLDAQLRARGETKLADRVKGQFEAVLETWPQDKSLFAALQSKEGYKMVLAQYNKLEQLKFLISQEVAVELGVVVGFNATDGD